MIYDLIEMYHEKGTEGNLSNSLLSTESIVHVYIKIKPEYTLKVSQFRNCPSLRYRHISLP